jgi:hypothetical protein
MIDRDDARIRLHQDVPLFREAIAFTAAKTGFNGSVIEKDYFCTVLLDDFVRQVVPGLEIACIDAMEAMAEKFRAALSRRDVAIRDFYDLDHAVRNLPLEVGSPSFIDLVRRKLSIPENPPVDVGSDRMAALRRQVDAKLKPVLRDQDFRDFDLDRAIALAVAMAVRIA